jgi:hypothetical protein
MSQRQRLVLDLALFVLVIVCANPAWTGIAPHQWFGIAIIVPALVHLIINWEWVERVIPRVFERIRAASVVNLVVDTVLFVATVAVTVSGFVVMLELMPAFGGTVSRTWLVTHKIASDTTVATLFVHLALHGRWIVQAVGRTIPSGGPSQGALRPLRIGARSARYVEGGRR